MHRDADVGDSESICKIKNRFSKFYLMLMKRNSVTHNCGSVAPGQLMVRT